LALPLCSIEIERILNRSFIASEGPFHNLLVSIHDSHDVNEAPWKGQSSALKGTIKARDEK
jgi:hypothetical protein